MADTSHSSHNGPVKTGDRGSVAPAGAVEVPTTRTATSRPKRRAATTTEGVASKLVRIENTAQEQQQGGADAVPELRVAVEAFGSGVLLHPGLPVSPGATVGDLRRIVMASVPLPPRTRTMRLFAGHGGAELDNDEAVLTASPLLETDSDNPVVVFPVACTSSTDDSSSSCARRRLQQLTTVFLWLCMTHWIVV